MGLNTFIYVLVLVSMSHNTHGRVDGITKEHIATYGNFDTCELARRTAQRYDGQVMYFCQKETLK